VASPRRNTPKPGRAIIALLIVMAALSGVMFWQKAHSPKLALDLAGGTTVTLTAVTESGKTAPPAQMSQALQIMRDRVNGLGVSEAEVTKQGANVIIIQVPGREGQQRIVKLIGTTAQLQFRQVFAAEAARATPPTAPPTTPSPTTTPKGKSDKAAKTPSPAATGGSTPSSTPRGRALSYALTAPTPNPSPQPSDSKPGTKSPKPGTSPSTPPPPPSAQGLAGVDDPAVIKQFQQLNCSGPNKQTPGADDPKRKWVAACDQDGSTKYILGPVRVEGRQVASANAVPPDPTQGQASWSVSLNFKSQGAKDFGAVTTDASNATAGTPQRQVAIVLDGTVVSAPSIDRGAIMGGQASIDGPPASFTQQYATDLASVLKYGALPLKFQQSSIETVSPTLGKDQLNAGLLAGAIGMGLVALYSLFYYRGLGLVSISSLVIAGLLTYESVALLGKFIDFRLSLAGIAGLIVAIGITADSFVVYFERLRDEVREGRSLRSAVERGWERARRTILVADAVSFLAAAVLYMVSIGSVKGFAFTLGLTTLIDVAVVFLFTKPMISWLASMPFFGKGHPMSGLDPRRLGGKTKVTARPVTKEA
jgi:preprotein translocase subunit SecD